eukprot:228292_1
MIMYVYSSDVTIISDFGFSSDFIQCGIPSETKTITYDIHQYGITAEDVYAEAQSLYNFNRFPCQDITFKCTDYHNQCKIKYEFITPLALIPIAYTSNTCYDININYLQKMTCDLNCNQVTKPDNQSYYLLDITFNYAFNYTDNTSTAVISLCKEFFGDPRSTKISLTNIDYIFSTSLSLYIYRNYIAAIKMYPKTTLLSNNQPYKNQNFSNCSPTKNTIFINLHTIFQV